MADTDLALLRLLLREQRLDVVTLQRLRGVPSLNRVLVEQGLLTAAELAEFRAALTTGGDPGLGRIAEYRLTARLGQGGMGAVYAAEHGVTGARRAIKVATTLHGEGQERFRREGIAQAQVDAHRNVLKVFGAGVDGGKCYLVMELAEGGDLARRLNDDGPLDPAEAVDIVAQLADGLQHVHEQGILHRDIKPANVLFNGDGLPLLVDFGLARLLDADTLTRTHALLGTPAYMAPEQVRGLHDEVDARTDVYALGAVLYECLTGEYMFEASGGLQVLAHVLNEVPQAPHALRPDVPVWLSQVCLRALAKAPAERFPTAAAFAAALRSGVSSPPPRSRTRAALGLGLLVAAAVTVGAWFALAATPVEEARPSVDANAIADVATRIHAGLHAPNRLLAQDGEHTAALRKELERLAEMAPADARLQRAQYELLLWEGLVAYTCGNDAAPQLAAMERLEAELSHTTSDFRTPGSAVALRALSRNRATLELLERSGLRRPELVGWRREVQAGRVLELVKTLQVREALTITERIEDWEAVPQRLRGSIRREARRLLETYLRWLPNVPPTRKTAPNKPKFDAFRLLRLLHHVDPVAGLTRGEVDTLLAFGLARTRFVFWTAPCAAAFVPDDVDVQLRVARHWAFLDRTTRPNRKLVAGGYLPCLERAHTLAQAGRVKDEMATLRADAMRLAGAYEKGIQFISGLLEEEPPNPVQARLLSIRGECRRLRGDHAGALADYDASLARVPLPLVRFRKAWALWTGPEARRRMAEARREALAALRGIQIKSRSVSREERLAYPRAAAVVYRTVVTTHSDYELALEAANLLLASQGGRGSQAGWLLRRAYVRLRIAEPQPKAAIADLEAALQQIKPGSPLADLRTPTRRALKAVRARGARAERRVWAVCKRLYRKPGAGRGSP